jgi:hypothetical protein
LEAPENKIKQVKTSFFFHRQGTVSHDMTEKVSPCYEKEIACLKAIFITLKRNRMSEAQTA